MSVKEIADVSQKSGCGDSMAVASANALSPNKGDFKSEYVRRFCPK
jgi:hypothetical protein